MNNLFLSGNIRIGKSTLLRKCLAPYRSMLGGFSSQRLLDAYGDIVGYRLAEAGDFEVERLYDPALPDVFITLAENGRSFDPSVFEGAADRLQPTSAVSIMLLDEIGGIDLVSQSFREQLYELFSSDIPCIGVLKDMSASRPGKTGYFGQPGIAEENLHLRRFLTRDNTSLLIETSCTGMLYDTANAQLLRGLEDTINHFLSGIPI